MFTLIKIRIYETKVKIINDQIEKKIEILYKQQIYQVKAEKYEERQK